MPGDDVDVVVERGLHRGAHELGVVVQVQAHAAGRAAHAVVALFDAAPDLIPLWDALAAATRELAIAPATDAA